MVPVTKQAHELITKFVNAGDVVIDATAGQGFDTLFLAEIVGTQGAVYAFDVQEQACQTTREKLAERGWKQAEVIQADHARMCEFVTADHQGQVAAVMFNLGYLPSSDKTITTSSASTLAALEASLKLLKAGGVICVAAYRGHAGGAEEAAAVLEWIDEKCSQSHQRIECSPAKHETAPVLYAIRKMTIL